jgi:dimethylargininase
MVPTSEIGAGPPAIADPVDRRFSIPEYLALTRAVSPDLGRCELTHLARRPIDVERARSQHEAYEATLAGLGCEVERVPAAPGHPDSVFIEDTAVVVPELAVMARPGAESRRGEVPGVAASLERHRPLAYVEAPATLDGGDVLRLQRRLYVGRSGRTNDAGARRLRELLEPLGYQVETVEVRGCLHLKTAVTAAADGVVVINPDWVDEGPFHDVRHVRVDGSEPFAANVLRIGDGVVVPASHPRTAERLSALGLEVFPVDLGELARAEGGVTCCSLLVSIGPVPG